MRKVIYLAVIFGILWFLWSPAVPSWTYRYRLALEVQVGDRVVTGSSVIQVVYTYVRRISLDGQEYQARLTGQAVAVDLGPPGILFALLKGNGGPTGGHAEPKYLARYIFGEAPGKSAPPETLPRMTGAKAEVPSDLLPLLIRFGNIRDPHTVQEVDPDDLGRSFGPDVRLKHTTIELVPAGVWPFNSLGLSWPIELTGVPTTKGIEKTLPWLEALHGSYLSGRSFGDRSLLDLHVGNFTMENL